MTSQWWSTLVSCFVLTSALASGGAARAQWGFPADHGQFGQGYGTGTAFGISPYDYGSFGGVSSVGFGTFGASYLSYFDLRNGGPKPQTTASFQSVSDVITLVPGWGGSTHRVRRIRQAQARRSPRAAAAVIAGRQRFR